MEEISGKASGIRRVFMGGALTIDTRKRNQVLVSLRVCVT